MLPPIFKNNSAKAFSLIIVKLLYANEENVVNPPLMPIARKILHSELNKLPLSDSPKTIPIIRLPATFAINVPHGKNEVSVRSIKI